MRVQIRSRRLVVAALAACAAAVTLVRAQAPPPPAHDISGIYVRIDDIGGGSWDGLNAAHPRPELLDTAGAGAGRGGADGRGGVGGRGAGGGRGAPPESNGPRPVGVPIQLSASPYARCATSSNFPGMLTRSVGFSVVQGKTQTLFMAEQPSARIIFTDGRPAPKPGDAPAGVAYSVGHWEADEFVIESIGVGGVPAGGRSGPNTKFTERYRLIKDGTVLQGTYTWDDSSIYAKPFTYQYQFSKSDKSQYSREEWCDSSDPAQAQSITPPAQIIK